MVLRGCSVRAARMRGISSRTVPNVNNRSPAGNETAPSVTPYEQRAARETQWREIVVRRRRAPSKIFPRARSSRCRPRTTLVVAKVTSRRYERAPRKKRDGNTAALQVLVQHSAGERHIGGERRSHGTDKGRTHAGDWACGAGDSPSVPTALQCMTIRPADRAGTAALHKNVYGWYSLGRTEEIRTFSRCRCTCASARDRHV